MTCQLLLMQPLQILVPFKQRDVENWVKDLDSSAKLLQISAQRGSKNLVPAMLENVQRKGVQFARWTQWPETK